MFFFVFLYLFLIFFYSSIVQVVIYQLGFGGAYGVGEVGEGLELDLLHGVEAEKEVAGGLGADAGDVGE